MKRFLIFSIAAASLLPAAGCSDSGTDDPATAERPVIVPSAPTVVVAPEGGAAQIDYSIEHPADGAIVAASTTGEAVWIHSFDTSRPGTIGFTADANDGECRTAVVRLSYPNAETATVTVVQGEAAAPQLNFRIEIVEKTSDSAVVTWTPSNDDESYMAMVVERSLFDSCASDEEYIRSDIAYVEELARAEGVNFTEMLARFLAKGPVTAEKGRISGLSPDTDYYAYAYGMTADGTPTSAIVKEYFRTDPFSCEFALDDQTTDTQSRVSITPSNTGCYYFWDMVPRTDYRKWVEGKGVIAANVELIRQAVEIAQMGGADIDFTYFLSVGPVESSLDVVPDTDYVLFAFALDETGRALTDVTAHDIRSRPFVASDDCSFRIGFSNVTSSAFDIDVAPTNDATRYYIGICTTELFESHSPDYIAASFIAMENRYGIDWAGDRYIYTGRQSVDTFYGLMMGSLSPSTDYTAVVFGVDTEGRRTTAVASAAQRTADVAPSNLTIRMTVRDITRDGADVMIYPSNDEEIYFADCIPYDDYAAFESDDACARAQAERAGAYIDYFLMQGNQTLDCHGYLEPGTRYIAIAFGYAGGITTPLFKSEAFTTEELRLDGKATLRIDVEIEDGDDLYAADPIKYAACKGKAYLYGRIVPSDDASQWYVAGFGSDISDKSDPELAAYLLANGYRNRSEVAFLGEWEERMTFTGVAVDAGGGIGRPIRDIVAIRKPHSSAANARSRSMLRRPAAEQTADAPHRTFLPAQRATPTPDAERPGSSRRPLESATGSARHAFGYFSSAAAYAPYGDAPHRETRHIRLRRF